MKRNTIFFSLFFTLVFICCANALSAQIVNTWKGGAPGHESDWAYYKNWSRGRTPNEFDRVVIPDVSTSTRSFPVIRSGNVEVLSLEVQAGASLTLLSVARLLTNEFECAGVCIGCEVRVWIEGSTKETAASAKY